MNVNLIEALEQLEEEKNISKLEVIDALEKALKVSYKKSFGAEENVEIEIDKLTGEIRILRLLEVVPDEKAMENPSNQIVIDLARKINHLCTVGDTIRQKINVKKFNRIAAQTAKQVLVQKIRELEKDSLFVQYKDLEGSIVTAEVMRPVRDGYEIRMGKLDTFIPGERLIPGEKFKSGDLIKVYIEQIEKSSRGALIKADRSSVNFVSELLKKEVPELENGIMEIKLIAREPGIRTKIALFCSNTRIDPVGASIGESGSRIIAVVKELKGEKVDVFEWSEDIVVLIKNALAPASVVEIDIVDKVNKISRIWVPPTQLSLAIGKGGQNARLAAKLTGWKIDIKPLLED